MSKVHLRGSILTILVSLLVGGSESSPFRQSALSENVGIPFAVGNTVSTSASLCLFPHFFSDM